MAEVCADKTGMGVCVVWLVPELFSRGPCLLRRRRLCVRTQGRRLTCFRCLFLTFWTAQTFPRAPMDPDPARPGPRSRR